MYRRPHLLRVAFHPARHRDTTLHKNRDCSPPSSQNKTKTRKGGKQMHTQTQQKRQHPSGISILISLNTLYDLIKKGRGCISLSGEPFSCFRIPRKPIEKRLLVDASTGQSCRSFHTPILLSCLYTFLPRRCSVSKLSSDRGLGGDYSQLGRPCITIKTHRQCRTLRPPPRARASPSVLNFGHEKGGK